MIPTLNEEDNLPECVELLENQMYGGDELIIVDGGSDDGTIEYAKEHADRVFIATTEEGPSTIGAARHIGVLKSKNPVIAQTDADGRPPDGWLETIRLNFESDDELDVLWGNIQDTNGVPIRNLIGQYSTLIRGASGNNTAFTKEAYMELEQGYPNISFGEDFRIINRLASNGKAKRDPDLVMRMNMDRSRYQTKPIMIAGLTAVGLGHVVGGNGGGAIQGAGLGLAGTEMTYEQIAESKKVNIHHDSLGAHIASFGSMLGGGLGTKIAGVGAGMILHHWGTEGMSFSPTQLQAMSEKQERE